MVTSHSEWFFKKKISQLNLCAAGFKSSEKTLKKNTTFALCFLTTVLIIAKHFGFQPQMFGWFFYIWFFSNRSLSPRCLSLMQVREVNVLLLFCYGAVLCLFVLVFVVFNRWVKMLRHGDDTHSLPSIFRKLKLYIQKLPGYIDVFIWNSHWLLSKEICQNQFQITVSEELILCWLVFPPCHITTVGIKSAHGMFYLRGYKN